MDIIEGVSNMNRLPLSIHIHVCIHTYYMHIYIHTALRPELPWDTPDCVAQLTKHTYTHILPHIHTLMHTYIHTHTHTALRPELPWDTPDCVAQLTKHCWHQHALGRPNVGEVSEQVCMCIYMYTYVL
jgi:hypothetical protein